MRRTTISVPNLNDSFEKVTLNGKVYYLRFTWNDYEQRWMLGIYDNLKVPIMTCIKIVPRYLLNLFCGIDEFSERSFYVDTELEESYVCFLSSVKSCGNKRRRTFWRNVHMNFNRSYRFSAGQAGGSGFEIGGEKGSNGMPLHISFSIERSEKEASNTGKVSIWNLNDEHIDALKEDDCVAVLKAGYQDSMPLIFTGVVTFGSTELDGADTVTDIEVTDTRVELRDTYVSLSYAGKVNTKDIITDVAGQMGVTPSFSYNAEFSELPNGYSYVGQAKNVLTKMCDTSNLVWSVQNGVLQIKKPNDVMLREVYVLSPDTGLLGIPKKINVSKEEEGKKTENGWDVVYLMNAAIDIDDYVYLESKLVKGYFRVSQIKIEGDNFSETWQCSARMLEIE